MAETVLVTGGTGYVAGWCIVQLLQRGYAVRTTVRSPAKQADVRAAVKAGGADDSRLSFYIADLTADAGWDAAAAGCDYVLHVASPLGGAGSTAGADAFITPARDGTLRVLRAAVGAGVKRVVMTSAAAVARPPAGSKVVADETVWSDPATRKFDPYRLSKVLAERAAWDFMAREGGATSFATILPGAVFGPVLSPHALGSANVIKGLLNGRPGAIPRLALWIVDVRDLADLHIRAMTAPQAAGQRFLATGEFMWMSDVAATLRKALGPRAAKVPTRRLPDLAFRALALFNPQFRMLAQEVGRRNPVSSDKARRMLGFAPRPAAQTVIDCANSLAGI